MLTFPKHPANIQIDSLYYKFYRYVSLNLKSDCDWTSRQRSLSSALWSIIISSKESTDITFWHAPNIDHRRHQNMTLTLKLYGTNFQNSGSGSWTINRLSMYSYMWQRSYGLIYGLHAKCQARRIINLGCLRLWSIQTCLLPTVSTGTWCRVF